MGNGVERSDWRELIRSQLRESSDLKRRVSETLDETILEAIFVVVESLKAGHKVMFCGNGGSAADAQHIAAELVGRTRAGQERTALPAISLTTDSSVLTALANDYGFDQVFQRQVEAIGLNGDVLVAISTSGNSLNVLHAVRAARERQIKTIGLLGRGGKLLSAVDHAISVPSDNTARIQETHIAIGHVICDLVEKMLFSEPEETR
ncbi:MAG TPA: D-sedoheptulose 7-phosphate isomerase [Dehalococcoidia bacterium]|nr:D-sedoheptulose 7-phosphate isomerase [Dehalococcoidia bacterium]